MANVLPSKDYRIAGILTMRLQESVIVIQYLEFAAKSLRLYVFA